MSDLLLFPDPPQRPAPPDTAVRTEALDIHRSFIVQAPAGSGKTTLLIQRLLKLLADDSVTTPEQILAITFTNAATAELRDRVLRALTEARSTYAETYSAVLPSLAASQPNSADFDSLTLELAGAVLTRDAALGWQLLSHPHRLNIRTIDSVCGEIARSLPVLSGSGGGLAPTEDAQPLYREAARRTLLELGGGNSVFDSALRDLLLHRDGNLADCESLIAEMLALRDQWGPFVPIQIHELDDAWLNANLLPRLERNLDRAISAALARLDGLLPAELLHDLASLAGHLGHLPGTNGDPSPLACCAGLHNPPEPLAAHLARWRAFARLLLTAGGAWRKAAGLNGKNLNFAYDRKHPHHAQLAAILDQLRHRDDLLVAFAEVLELPNAHYPANQWAVAKSLFRVLSHALVQLQFVFAARGQCDFTELSLLARSALRCPSGANDLAAALGARLQHLLVDEMQDTSTGQYELLELLTTAWDGYSQTVFLVGDPYQSIYLFRQARVERFVRALQTRSLGELPLTPLALTANFRSQRTLVHQFNDDFGLIFATSQDHGLKLIRAEPTQPATSAKGRIWHANPQPPSGATTTASPPRLGPTQAHRDAETIASIAAQWLKSQLPPGRDKPWRIAVLVRSRKHLTEIISALRRNAVPFRAVDIETLRDRQEVLDLTALARALLQPADRVAALAVLRAPWCGLPLADLHTLTGTDDFSLRNQSILRLIQSRAHLLSEDSRHRLTRIHAVLTTALEARSRLTTAQLVERAWRSLGGDAPLTASELTNAQRFFELLDTLEASTGGIDPMQLEDRLDQLFAEPEAFPAHTGFVELLTIHKAKGLEWDVVLVPSLERRPAFGFSRLLTWSVLEELDYDDSDATPILLAPIAARGEDVDPLTTWLKRRHREREYAENKRLFYVACTRARQELHLFAAPTLSSQGISPRWPDSLLKAAWPAAGPHFIAIQLSQQTQIPGERDLPEQVFDLAATADETSPDTERTQPSFIDLEVEHQVSDSNLIVPEYPLIQRLPLNFVPASRYSQAHPDLHLEPGATTDRTQFSRPEGSFAARSFGNVLHACIELLTARVAAGSQPASLLAELPKWSPRIHALLRADGLSAPLVSRLARETRAALENMLHDPDGQWLLAAHPGSAAEYSLTVTESPTLHSSLHHDEISQRAIPLRPVSLRLDRLFRAGPEPHTAGTEYLWIVDYKSASHSAANMDEFFARQRTAYSSQLEAYARTLVPVQSITQENIRLALYFPALDVTPRLLWWPYRAPQQ